MEEGSRGRCKLPRQEIDCAPMPLPKTYCRWLSFWPSSASRYSAPRREGSEWIAPPPCTTLGDHLRHAPCGWSARLDVAAIHISGDRNHEYAVSQRIKMDHVLFNRYG
ncbi:hypothetical protein ACP70R_039092 [Stipagrostis hirtigluma subsp. patula]